MPLLNKKQKKVFLPPGQLINIDGFRLHFHCTGPSDNTLKLPTVVIEAGCGCSLFTYSWLQETLSQTLRVCSYDRSGLGWSEENHQPRDAEHIATQLHTLLNKAGIDGPIILVGHSIAGLYLRVYANKYPNNIVAMVLLDSSHPRQNEVLEVSGFTLRQRLNRKVMAAYASLGIAKLYSPLWELKNSAMNYLPESSQQQLAYLLGFRQSYITPLIEFDAFGLAAKQALSAGDLDDLPLLVMTAPAADGDLSKNINWKTHIDAWLGLQKDLLKLSSNSQHKIIEGAGHCTMVTKRQYAEQVANEILQLIEQIN